MQIDLGEAPTALAIILAAWLAFLLGRGEAKKDRLRAHAVNAVVDTRDRLLDLVSQADALARLSADDITALATAVRTLRYSRARTDLIAEDHLIELLERTLPAVLRTFPKASQELQSDIVALGNEVREAMYEQERLILDKGKPKRQSPQQRCRVDAMLEAVTKESQRFRGWARVRLQARLWVRMKLGV